MKKKSCVSVGVRVMCNVLNCDWEIIAHAMCVVMDS